MLLKNEKLISIVLFLSAIFFVILYISSVNNYWKITPDSSTYISGAKTLASGDGYKEQGKPITLFPPMTSVVYGISYYLSNDNSYFLQNLTVTLFAILSLMTFYYTIRNDIGQISSLIIILLSLGSVHLFYESTFLLSDVIYMFFSLYSLKIANDYLIKQENKYDMLLLIFIVLLACMTRIIGLSLVLSILIYMSLSRITGRARINMPLVIFMLFIICIVLLWDYRGYIKGFSNFEIMMQKEAWVDESGYVNLIDLASRFVLNSRKLLSIGDILSNGALKQIPILHLVVNISLLLLCCTGFAISNRRLNGITGIYTILYLIVLFSFHRTAGGYRYFVPIIPIIFFYLVNGVKYLNDRFKEFINLKYIYFITIIYLLIYLIHGTTFIMGMIPDEHKSPFGDHPIKYPYNYDTQALAFFLNENSRPDETYVCFHPEIMDLITRRTGYHIPFSSDPDDLLNLMQKNNISYVLFDKKKKKLAKFFIPAISNITIDLN